MELVHRRDIKGAPYNPRLIDDHARKKLEENLKKTGLLAPLVWNKRTGNLVSGHQRLSIMDDLERDDNYAMDIAVVDLDPTTERSQNVFFNNPSAQGTWDIDALGEMLKDQEHHFEPSKAGFDPMDLQVLFDDTELAPMFALENQPEVVQKAGATLDEIKEMRKTRQEFKDENQSEMDPEFVSVIVFDNSEAQARFMSSIGMAKDDRYADGARVQSIIDAARDKRKLSDGFIAVNFVLAKDQHRVVEAGLKRIGQFLTGKNIRGRSLEYMAVNALDTPLGNLTGEEPDADKVASEEKRIRKIKKKFLRGEGDDKSEKKRKKKRKKDKEES